MKPERVKGHLDLILLGTLSRSPGHGYAVITALREQTEGLLDLTEGAVYPALHRLEDLGWLESEWELVAGRRRRIYQLTGSGRAALNAEQRDWRALVSAVDAVLRPGPSTVAATRAPPTVRRPRARSSDTSTAS
jgi:PadR family transcriptional regulator PadR